MTACTVDGCMSPQHARELCNKHYKRWAKHGDANHVERITGRPLKGLAPTWAAIHKRLARTRGSAERFSCVDCGGIAQEWSYDGSDPDELIGRSGKSNVSYSLDLNHYQPRCISCHRIFDGAGNRDRDRRGRFEKRYGDIAHAEVTVREVLA